MPKAKDGIPVKPPVTKPPPTKPDLDWNDVDLLSKTSPTHVGVDSHEVTVVSEDDVTVTYWPRQLDADGKPENYARVTMNRDNFEAHYAPLSS